MKLALVQRASEQIKFVADGTSITVVLTAWLGVLSTGVTILATLAALAWSCIRIYETKTVQRWLGKK